MATRAPLLTTSFGGYYHRDVPPEDTELTHIYVGDTIRANDAA